MARWEQWAIFFTAKKAIRMDGFCIVSMDRITQTIQFNVCFFILSVRKVSYTRRTLLQLFGRAVLQVDLAGFATCLNFVTNIDFFNLT